MNVGIIGVGKLGLPVAFTLAKHGVEVGAYDVTDTWLDAITEGRSPHREEGLDELLNSGLVVSRVQEMQIEDMPGWADVVLVAVQTPHDPEYDGSVPVPDQPKDFSYTWLVDALRDLDAAIGDREDYPAVCVVSTVMPGTHQRELADAIRVPLHYTPYFIAMGTVVHDMENPEFVLIGHDNWPDRRVFELYDAIHGPHGKDTVVVPIVDAEMIKISYNTWISAKVAFVNHLAMLTDAVGGHVDNVTTALGLATDRLISTRYMTAGMGDGGACHPRDNIAVSDLIARVGLDHDLPREIMRSREAHAAWLASWMTRHQTPSGRPMVIIGTAFKPETAITAGSHALLVHALLTDAGHDVATWDPLIDDGPLELTGPSIVLIGCQHQAVDRIKLPHGSVVIDPTGQWMPHLYDVGELQIIKPGRMGLDASTTLDRMSDWT